MAGPPRVPISGGSTDATPIRFSSGVRSLLGYGRVPSPVPILAALRPRPSDSAAVHFSGNLERLMGSIDSIANGSEKQALSEEQRTKINEVRASLGPLPDKLVCYSSDASIARYLTARNWNVTKATKMLKETLKWHLEYKPEEIRWDEIAHEAETGKIYRSSYSDKFGRSILVMRPGYENTRSTKGKIRYLVYCMENAILNLPPDQEQMVWLIDFKGFNLSNISIRTAKETADVLQNHYPERLGLAILYNPPKFFEPFWTIAKHLLEPKTCRKVKFVYSDDDNTKKTMEEFFDMDELDCGFGGNNQVGFNISDYAARMKEDDKRMHFIWSQENASSSSVQHETIMTNVSGNSGSDCDKSENGTPGR
nr:PREDICTED: random slug protein 5-like [Musa acuminata subsp. malaccensis]